MAVSQNIVKLNVGGKLFSTSYETLTKYDGFLSILVSTQLGVKLDENGYIFIDRNGGVFKHILEFLRSGYIPDFDSLGYLKQLLVEVDFYQIRSLIEIINIQIARNELLLLEIIKRSEANSVAQLKANNDLDKNYIIELEKLKFSSDPDVWLKRECMNNSKFFASSFSAEQIVKAKRYIAFDENKGIKLSINDRKIVLIDHLLEKMSTDENLKIKMMNAYRDARKIHYENLEKMILK